MNAFYEHHKDSIRFHYRCFDRLLLHAAIQPFYQPERAQGFFSVYRGIYPVSRDVLRDIARQQRHWVISQARKWKVPVLDAPTGRRDEFISPYFRRARPDRVVAILKAREAAPILISIGKQDRWHLELRHRWVDQFYFYLLDEHFQRMFVRVCPYFPFAARLCFNQHHWIAARLKEEGIRYRQCGNAFLQCGDPQSLQQIADSITAADLEACAAKWLTRLVPFFTETEREHGGCRHRLFFSQVEYCDNLIFKRRSALDRMGERLLDANRTIGQPTKLSVIYGRRITKRYAGKLQTTIADLGFGNSVIRSHYKNGFIKQYVRDKLLVRTEATTNNVQDYGCRKSVRELDSLRTRLEDITQSYLDVQQDILETFVDRGLLRRLGAPTVLTNGKRIPGLKLDHARQLAVMQALVRFSHIAAQNTFSTKEIYNQVVKTLAGDPQAYSLGSLRYDLSKLRAKDLVHKLPRTHRYHLSPDGYQVCLIYLKLFQRVYAPLLSGIRDPLKPDLRLRRTKLTKLDRLYLSVTDALDRLVSAVGLRVAA